MHDKIFIFAIGGHKLTRAGMVDKLIKHKIRGPFFYMHPWNDLGGRRDQFTLTQKTTLSILVR